MQESSSHHQDTAEAETLITPRQTNGASRTKVNISSEVNDEIDETSNDDDKGTAWEKAPDGGWGWFIVVGSLIIRITAGGIARCEGIFYNKIQERFNSSATSTAVATSLTVFVRLAIGPFASILTNRFSCRLLATGGAFLICLGLILSAFTPSTTFLYFSFGVVLGIGRAFAVTPTPIIVGYYFEERRSLAFGLASAGSSIGGFIMAPVIEVLFEHYGFQGAFLVLSGITTHAFIGSTLFRPIALHRRTVARERKKLQSNAYSTVEPPSSGLENDPPAKTGDPDTADDVTEDKEFIEQNTSNAPTQQNSYLNCCGKSQKPTKNGKDDKKTKLISLSILKDVRFVCYLLLCLCVSIPSTLLFLPALAKARGVSDIRAAYLISAVGASDMVSRVLSGFLMDLKVLRSIRPQIFCGMVFCESLVEAMIPLMTNFEGLMTVSLLLGCMMGYRGAQAHVIMMDIIGVDKIASSLALTLGTSAVSSLIGPAIAGRLKDTYGTYDVAFFLFAAAIFVGGCIMSFGFIHKQCTD